MPIKNIKPLPSDENSTPYDLIKVRCVSDARPWTSTRLLEYGDVVEITRADAEILIPLGFVETL